MPWCEECARYWAPPTLRAGACPTCSRVLVHPTDGGRTPWHFRLLVAAVAAYLALRAYQGLEWLLQRS